MLDPPQNCPPLASAPRFGSWLLWPTAHWIVQVCLITDNYLPSSRGFEHECANSCCRDGQAADYRNPDQSLFGNFIIDQTS